jgi:hypothetical protein
MDYKKLSEPFAPYDIEWRIQSSGKRNGKPWGMCLAYVTNRAIMDRLDSVVGPENWRNEFTPGPEGGVMCGISVRRGDEWVTKWDGAENTDIEAVKGGLSSAMKRAAVQWGIGRYLYNLTTGWARFTEDGQYSAKIDGEYHKWSPPDLPPWALPGGNGEPFDRGNAAPVTEPERTERAARIDKMNPATEGDINKMLETFAKRGVTRADIEEYLGHTLKAGTDGAADMSVLRGIYSEMFSGKRADTWFPRWTGDVDVSGAAIAERVLGMNAKLDASLANIEPLVP